jgi:hypothetical protein
MNNFLVETRPEAENVVAPPLQKSVAQTHVVMVRLGRSSKPMNLKHPLPTTVEFLSGRLSLKAAVSFLAQARNATSPRIPGRKGEQKVI